MKIRNNPTDKLFSLYIRTRDKWRCQRCGTQYHPPTSGLHCAHCFGRRVKATRWRETNALALCYGCHSHLDTNQKEKDALFIKKFGEQEWKTNRALHDLRTRSKVYEPLVREELKRQLNG